MSSALFRHAGGSDLRQIPRLETQCQRVFPNSQTRHLFACSRFSRRHQKALARGSSNNVARSCRHQLPSLPGDEIQMSRVGRRPLVHLQDRSLQRVMTCTGCVSSSGRRLRERSHLSRTGLVHITFGRRFAVDPAPSRRQRTLQERRACARYRTLRPLPCICTDLASNRVGVKAQPSISAVGATATVASRTAQSIRREGGGGALGLSGLAGPRGPLWDDD